MAKGNKSRSKASYYYNEAYGEMRKSKRIAKDEKLKKDNKEKKEIRKCSICSRKWKCRKTSGYTVCCKCRNEDERGKRG